MSDAGAKTGHQAPRRWSGFMRSARTVRAWAEQRWHIAFALVIAYMIATIAISVVGRHDRFINGLTTTIAVAAEGLGAVRDRNASKPQMRKLRNFNLPPGFVILTAEAMRWDVNLRAIVQARVLEAASGPSEDGAAGLSSPSLPSAIMSVGALQFFAVFVALGAAMHLGWRLGGTREAGVLTMVLFFIAAPLGNYATIYYSPVWAIALSLVFLSFLLETWRAKPSGAVVYGAAAGFVGAVWVLFEPVAAVGLVTGLLVLLFGGNLRWLSAAAFAGGAALVTIAVTSIWPDVMQGMLINALVLTLAERASFNDIDLPTALCSLVEPIPVLGGMIAWALPERTALELGVYGPSVLLVQTYANLMPEVWASDPTAMGRLQYLFDTRIATNWVGYIGSLPTIAMRGLFAGGNLIALFGVLRLASMWGQHRAGEDRAYVRIVLLVLGIMLVAKCLLTPNGHWANTPLLVLYAYVIASLVCRQPRQPLMS